MTLNEVMAVAKDAGFEGVILEMIAHTYKLGAENEREALLDLVDAYAKNNTDLAEAIRARGG